MSPGSQRLGHLFRLLTLLLCRLRLSLFVSGVLSSSRLPPLLSTQLDTGGILFFFGVLLSVGALESSGLLKQLAVGLSDAVGDVNVIAALIGLASAVIDNVPLVAATMGMYSLDQVK